MSQAIKQEVSALISVFGELLEAVNAGPVPMNELASAIEVASYRCEKLESVASSYIETTPKLVGRTSSIASNMAEMTEAAQLGVVNIDELRAALTAVKEKLVKLRRGIAIDEGNKARSSF